MKQLNKLIRKFALVLAAVMGLAGTVAAADYPMSMGKSKVISKKKIGKPVRRAAMAKKRPAVKSRLARVEVPTKPSVGQLAGLHDQRDELHLKSSAVLVMDQDTKEVLFRKNDQVVLPIASLTKLMTGVLISEAQLSLDEPITITQDDVDTEKGSHSRLKVGTELSRGELLHLALMSSENRAAHALGRTYPGGLTRFVGLMNQKAVAIGMRDTSYVEPTGLSTTTSPAPRIWRPWSAMRTATPPCVSSRPHRDTRSRWAAKSCSTATPTVWSKTRTGISACKKPATSPRRGSAW